VRLPPIPINPPRVTQSEGWYKDGRSEPAQPSEPTRRCESVHFSARAFRPFWLYPTPFLLGRAS